MFKFQSNSLLREYLYVSNANEFIQMRDVSIQLPIKGVFILIELADLVHSYRVSIQLPIKGVFIPIFNRDVNSSHEFQSNSLLREYLYRMF